MAPRRYKLKLSPGQPCPLCGEDSPPDAWRAWSAQLRPQWLRAATAAIWMKLPAGDPPLLDPEEWGMETLPRAEYTPLPAGFWTMLLKKERRKGEQRTWDGVLLEPTNPPRVILSGYFKVDGDGVYQHARIFREPRQDETFVQSPVLSYRAPGAWSALDLIDYCLLKTVGLFSHPWFLALHYKIQGGEGLPGADVVNGLYPDRTGGLYPRSR